jgi:uncharacterized protein DUF4403
MVIVRGQIAYPRRLRLTMLATLLLGCAACGENSGTVDAPAPVGEFSHDPDSLPALPPGTIVAPLTLQLAGARNALERIVPRRFGNITQRLPIPGSGRKSYAYEVARDPFSIAFAHDTVVLAATIHYKGRAWYDPPIGPDINGECGTRGEPPRARLVLRILPRLSKDWRLQVRSRVAQVVPLTTTERDQCEVSFLKLDMTSQVLEVAGRALQATLPQIDRKLGRLDLRTPLGKIWNDLQKPIRLQDSLWLLLYPQAVNLGSMSGSRESVGAEIGITAAPRIVTGPRPALSPFPMPQLGSVASDQGFSLLVEGTFDYGVMSAELTHQLAGRSIKAAGGVLEVKKLTVYGVGGGKLALGLDFDGTAKGRLWLLGKPSYDAASGLLSVPDLDFDTGSAGLLLQGLAWLKGSAIREFLRSQAKIPAGILLARIQELAVRELNRVLARGVTLSAFIEKTEPAGILVRSDGLVIRARAIGAARLDVGAEVFEPKPTVDH